MTDPLPRPAEPTDLVNLIRQRTPARILVGRRGAAHPTDTPLALRQDHAAARDACPAELALKRDLGDGLVGDFSLFLVTTQAGSRTEYLLRPDLGRRLSDDSREKVQARCPTDCDLQVVVGDGLSVPAVAAQVPVL